MNEFLNRFVTVKEDLYTFGNDKPEWTDHYRFNQNVSLRHISLNKEQIDKYYL